MCGVYKISEMLFRLPSSAFVLFVIFPVLINGEAKYAIKFGNYKLCENVTETKVTFHNLKIHRPELDQYILLGKMVIHEDIPAPIYLGCYLESCPDKNKPNSCQYLWQEEMPDLCKDLKDPKSKGYDFVNNTLNIPNPRCPLPAGKYRLETKPIDTKNSGDRIALMGPNRMYKMQLYFYQISPEKKKIINSCIYLESEVEPKSNRAKNYDGKFPKNHV